MLGLLILFFLAKWLFDLAKKHQKPPFWLYGLFAVISYYAAGFVGVFLTVLVIYLSAGSYNVYSNSMMLSLLEIPFGVSGVWLLHTILKRNWESPLKANPQNQLLDDTSDEF